MLIVANGVLTQIKYEQNIRISTTAGRSKFLGHFFWRINMSRLRTIAAAHQYLADQDPDTSVTQHFLRSLVIRGAIPCIKAGKKFLIDIDELENQLCASLAAIETPETPANRGVRSISSKRRLT
jgi:hypothetical protein